jgi:diacylglycerol kinase family enzyme
MNIFVYDDFLDKYKKTVRIIEENLNKLNLQGKILYLKNIKNLKEALQNEIGNGAKTIISVGNNKTANLIINILANFSEKIPLAIIPVGKENSIAQSLGITNEKEACFILSSRRIEKINLAEANNILFINRFFIKNKGTTAIINNSYDLAPQKSGEFFIYNLPPAEKIFENIQISPQDDILNLYIQIGAKNKTHLLIKEIEIKNNNENGLLDDLIEIKMPVQIKSSGKSIDLIVGKERFF